VFHSSSSGSSVFSSPVIAGFWLKVAALVREMCEIEGAGWGGGACEMGSGAGATMQCDMDGHRQGNSPTPNC